MAVDEQAPNGRNQSARRFTIIGLIILAAIGIAIVINYLIFAHSHVSTENAYLTEDVVQISSQVNATVQQVLVSENQDVKEGDLLVMLDDAPYRAGVAQRQADLDAAIAQAKGAGVSVALTTETGSAQMMQASGMVEQAQGGIGSAKADVARTEAGIKTASANAESAEANIGTAQAGLNSAVANKKKAQDAIGSAQAQLDATKAGVHAAQAVYDRAAKDADRFSQLVDRGAVSKQTFDDANSAALTAQAQLESAKAMVVQRESDLEAARQQLEVADAGIAQAKAQLSASKKMAEAAREGVNQTEAQRTAALENVVQAQARSRQAQGQMSQAETAPRQVALSKSARTQALARIEQAQAALESAKLQLSYTRVYAPSDGRVSKKAILVGALVQPGSPLMAIVERSRPKVVANYKETQVEKIVPGDSAEIRVDALPGMRFKGQVESISAATGATFALLPPDNATGNFTKVVQRIPVRIVLDTSQPGIDRLRTGMSVKATVAIK